MGNVVLCTRCCHSWGPSNSTIWVHLDGLFTINSHLVDNWLSRLVSAKPTLSSALLQLSSKVIAAPQQLGQKVKQTAEVEDLCMRTKYCTVQGIVFCHWMKESDRKYARGKCVTWHILYVAAYVSEKLWRAQQAIVQWCHCLHEGVVRVVCMWGACSQEVTLLTFA